MKNQYFGDISDYWKYGILRGLAHGDNHRILVGWMLTADDGRTDGAFTDYLSAPETWRRYDPALYDVLVQAVRENNTRNAAVAEQINLIPGAVYVPDLLDDTNRTTYFDRVTTLAKNVDIVFLDPDNGLEVASVGYGKKNSHKYLYWREVETLYATGVSLLIYQHFRRVNRDVFIRTLALDMMQHTGSKEVLSFRTAHTVFFLVMQDYHRRSCSQNAARISERWKDQIDILIHTPTEAKPIHARA